MSVKLSNINGASEVFPKKYHVMPELSCKDVLCKRERNREGYNAAIASLDSLEVECDVEKLAKQLFLIEQKDLYGKDGVSWEVALECERKGDKSCRRWRDKAKALSTTLAQWLVIRRGES